MEIAGAESTFRIAWECARPNAIVTVVALYDKAQELPLPNMYGKNLTFKTGGVDGCDCEETLKLIAEGKINTEPLITHTYPLSRIEEAYNTENGGKPMAVSYDKLWVILNEREMMKTDLIRAAKISTNAMAKLGKNEDVRVGVLVKICETLDCKLDDIVDIV